MSDDPTYLTWTGTMASAQKLEDDINAVDRLLHKTAKNYCTVEIVRSDSFCGADWIAIDTLSNYLRARPGESIKRGPDKWELVEKTNQS